MMKRVTWFAGGVVAGVTASGLAARKVKRTVAKTVDQLKPVNVAKAASARVRDAVAEGREAMRVKEAELRARRDGSPAPAEANDLTAGSGPSAQVIELRPSQVRERAVVTRARRASRRG